MGGVGVASDRGEWQATGQLSATLLALRKQRVWELKPACCSVRSLIFPGVRLASDSQFSDFLDGLGPAQLVGRQTLATPAMGEFVPTCS